MSDPVTQVHASYPAAAARWQRCRDVFEGGDVVKAAGSRYLPALGGQTADEYAAYNTRAMFYGGFGRSVVGLTGIAFATPPAVTTPKELRDVLADITLASEPFEAVAVKAVQEVLIVGRRGILIDFSTRVNRPYWAAYAAEQIVDWDTRQVDGDTILSWLVLKESRRARTRFEVVVTDQYRVCELVQSATSRDPVYMVTIYTKTASAGANPDAYVAQPATVPLRLGQPLSFIPFVFLGPTGILPAIAKPPMLDVVDVNLSHYRSSADLEHGRHFTALPTPVVTGAKVSSPMRIGSSHAWVLEEPGADAKFLEFTGNGLKTLEEALAQKERLMSILGSRLLEDQKVGQEAAATVRMRHAGDNATLQSIVGSVSLALTMALRWTSYWAGIVERTDDDTVRVLLNTDFAGVDVDLNGLSLLAQADKISFATLYFNLQRMGLTRPNVTPEQERQQILSEGGIDPLMPPVEGTLPGPQ